MDETSQKIIAFIEEYVHEDGTMDADFLGIYVIALRIGLVPDEIRPKMAEHLCRMTEANQAIVHVTVPVNTTAKICLPGKETETVGSGTYTFMCRQGKE